MFVRVCLGVCVCVCVSVCVGGGVAFAQELILRRLFYAPATKSGGGHIVLPLSVRTSVTRFNTLLVSATPPKVFDAET